MATNRKDEIQEAVLSWAKASTKNKNLAIENTTTLVPSKNKINLRKPPRGRKKLKSWRGVADRQVFWHNFSHKQHNLSGEAGDVLTALQMSRAEILGSMLFQGSRINIELETIENNFLSDDDPKFSEVIRSWFKSINGFGLSQDNQKFINAMEELQTESTKKIAVNLCQSINDETTFLKHALLLVKNFGLIDKEDEGSADSEYEQAEQNVEDTPEEIPTEEDIQTTLEQQSPIESEATEGDDFDDHQIAEVSIDEELEAVPVPKNHNFMKTDSYQIFSNKFDEIIHSSELANIKEINRLRLQLDKLIKPHLSSIGKLANRLQRLLLARQERAWQFDMDEGILDTSKLTRIVTDPGQPLSFKVEKNSEFKNTVISLLIDCSGSMRGRSINLAAVCAEIIGTTLERCSVKTEVLGYTTKHWKGGDSRKQWMQRGSFSSPGRLNDLRHIIFKAADDNWRKSKKSLGVILKDGLLKENIDGEALAWAHNRLVQRDEERKILIVISDGAPVDDSSLSANHSHFLEEHLHAMIHNVNQAQQVELLAIGIGHDVGKYYDNAITINNAETLGETLLEKLTDLFE